MATPPKAALQPGSTDTTSVKQLQDYLVSQGLLDPSAITPASGGYGIYGAKTTAAVLALQNKLGVPTSSGPGYWGPLTMAAVNASGSTSQTQQQKDLAGGNVFMYGYDANGARNSAPGVGNSPATTSTAQPAAPAGAVQSGGWMQALGVPPGGPSGIMTVQQMADKMGVTVQALAAANPKLRTQLSDPNTRFDLAYLRDTLGGLMMPIPTATQPTDPTGGAVVNPDTGQVSYPSTNTNTPTPPITTPATPVENVANYLYNKSRNNSSDSIGQNPEMLAQQVILGESKIGEGGGGLDKAFVDKILNDPNVMAKYIGALAYGGYTPVDVYKDILRQQMAQSNPALNNLQIISPSQNRVDYYNSTEGKAAASNTSVVVPQQIGNISAQSLNLPIYNLPDALFKELVPILDVNSQAFKDQVAQVKSAYYDVMQLQNNAKTEVEKAQADAAYNAMKSRIENIFHITLSNNSNQAWGQINNIAQTYAQNNLSDSGLQANSTDDMLHNARLMNQNFRTNVGAYQNQVEMSHAVGALSPEQVKNLTPEQRAQYGLTPSQDVLNALDMNTLKAKYPNEDPAVLQNYRDSIIDQNGNYRSSIYQNNAANTLANTTAARNNASDTVLRNAGIDAANAYRTFDASQTVIPLRDNNSTAGQSNTSTNSAASTTTSPTNSSPIINFDPNTGKQLTSGQSVTFQGKTYTQGQPFSSVSSTVSNALNNPPTSGSQTNGQVAMNTDYSNIMNNFSNTMAQNNNFAMNTPNTNSTTNPQQSNLPSYQPMPNMSSNSSFGTQQNGSLATNSVVPQSQGSGATGNSSVPSSSGIWSGITGGIKNAWDKTTGGLGTSSKAGGFV